MAVPEYLGRVLHRGIHIQGSIVKNPIDQKGARRQKNESY